MTIYASKISRELYNWIQEKDRYGEIHSIFKNTINILSEDGRFIPIFTNDKPMGPNSIKLGEGFAFEALNLRMGGQCLFTKESLTSKDIKISYKDAEIWDNRIQLVTSIDSYENIIKKLKCIKEFILKKGNKDGIFGLIQIIPGNLYDLPRQDIKDKSQLFIKERFISFIEEFINKDMKNINNSSKKIIGFGPGLTPSMDDFLSGMMIANLYISNFLGLNIEVAYKLNGQIVKDIGNMTTLVSEEILKLSSIGETNQDIKDLMIFLTSNVSEGQIEEIMSRVIEFGHSSGTDILCGIYIGSYILLYKHKEFAI